MYQYSIYELNRVLVDDQAAGEFVYAISGDRGTSFGLQVIVMPAALEAWAAANGRALTASEEYAVAKMRLFQAFDEGEIPVTAKAAREVRLVVDESNLEALLKLLGIRSGLTARVLPLARWKGRSVGMGDLFFGVVRVGRAGWRGVKRRPSRRG